MKQDKEYNIHIVYGTRTDEGLRVDPSIPDSDFYEKHTVKSLMEFIDDFITDDKQDFPVTKVRKMLNQGNTFCFLCAENDGTTSMFFMPDDMPTQTCQ